MKSYKMLNKNHKKQKKSRKKIGTKDKGNE